MTLHFRDELYCHHDVIIDTKRNVGSWAQNHCSASNKASSPLQWQAPFLRGSFKQSHRQSHKQSHAPEVSDDGLCGLFPLRRVFPENLQFFFRSRLPNARQLLEPTLPVVHLVRRIPPSAFAFASTLTVCPLLLLRAISICSKILQTSGVAVSRTKIRI